MDITLAVANQLGGGFPGAIIYRENQEQGFAEPSFYIYEIMAGGKDELMGQEMRQHLYCVMWFPDSNVADPGIKEQCEMQRGVLLNEFNFLDDLSLKLLDREIKIEQGAVNLTFKVRYKVRKETRLPTLERLTQQGGVKNVQ